VTAPEQAQDWREAIALYYPRVRAWFAHVLDDRAAVDDLTQEVFVRLCDRLTKGEVMHHPWGFIKVMARHVFLEYLRTQKKQRGLLPLDEQVAADGLPQPAEVVARKEVSEAIPRLLVHLPVAHRHILVGRYFLGLTVREIAEAMGIAASTVLEWHNRAVCRLRRLALDQGITL